nr:SDR family oxidoreductase [Thioalkalivibrio sp.]
MASQSDQQTVMVTGATGFLGRALVARLASEPRFVVRAASRSANPGWPQCVVPIQMGDLGGSPDYAEALRGVSCLIHSAARVHVSANSAPDALASFHSVNVVGTRRLAEQAADAGVRRFIFVSSVKVNGASTEPGEPFRMSDIPRPQCAYGISKWQAEQALWQVAAETGLEIAVVRPPLAYGPGVKANVLRLMRLVDRGWPLPLAAVDNRRSLVALDNLVDLLTHCIDHPAAPGQTFLVSDGHDLSTPELVRGLAHAMGRPVRLFRVPLPLLRIAGQLSGRLGEFERLTDSLQVDIRATCETLGWEPPLSVQEGLLRAVAGRD